MQHAWTRWIVGLGSSLVLAGAVVAVWPDRSDDRPTSVGAGPFLDGAGVAVALPTDDAPTLDPAPAVTVPAPPTPEAAVESFFLAEISDDFTTSFGLLSDRDREAAGNAGEWAATHDELPAFERFDRAGPAEIDGDEAVVTGTARMTPVVDETVGIFPGEAEVAMAVVREDGGWRVSFADSVLQPVLPDDAAAPAAATAWIERRRSCDETSEPYQGALVGDPRIAAALCGSTDRFVVSDTGGIDDLPDPVPFLTAFGPDSVGLLRSVTFDGPRPLSLVVAPLGEDWVVVGAE